MIENTYKYDQSFCCSYKKKNMDLGTRTQLPMSGKGFWTGNFLLFHLDASHGNLIKLVRRNVYFDHHSEDNRLLNGQKQLFM